MLGRGTPENVLAPIVIRNQGMLQACSIGNAPDACALKASLREFCDRRVQNGRARGKSTLLLRARFAVALAVTNGLGGAVGATLVHYPPCCWSPTDVLEEPAGFTKCSFRADARSLRQDAPPSEDEPSEGSVSVLPLIARRNGREHVPMLRNLSILHSEKIIVRGGRLSTCFDQSEHEVAFCQIAARHEDPRAAGLRHLRNPRFHARNPITNFGGVLGVSITVDEFIDTIKTQLDRHDLLEGANERSICFCAIAINDSGRTIDLRMAGRIGANLGVLSAPMFDDFSALETKQVEGDDRPREAAQAFVLRMKHDG